MFNFQKVKTNKKIKKKKTKKEKRNQYFKDERGDYEYCVLVLDELGYKEKKTKRKDRKVRTSSSISKIMFCIITTAQPL